jgi:hypothetical protein
MKSFGHLSGHTHHFARHLLPREAVLENQLSIERQAARHGDERSMVIHAQRGHFKCGILAAQCHVNIHAHPQKHALAASPFFSRYGLSNSRSAVRRRDL